MGSVSMSTVEENNIVNTTSAGQLRALPRESWTKIICRRKKRATAKAAAVVNMVRTKGDSAPRKRPC